MANPSETYAVDSTLTFGTTEVNLTKDLSTLYPTLNSEIDNSISINALNDDLVKTVYRKSDKFNSLYDEAITFSSSPAGGSDVVKYYARNGFPADSVNITNAIIYGANNENRVYATGYSGDASSIYNANSAGGLKFIRDLDYNKILFAITAKEYSSIPVLAKGTIDYDHGSHETPSTTSVDLKDIDPNKYYMGYDGLAAKVWNGSGWSDINAHPILVCNGETVQSIQSAGTAFYSEMCNYGMVKGSGQNIDLSISSTNQMNYGYNFCNVMDRAKYTLGWADSYSAIPNWADIHEDIFTEINQHMIDNSQSNMSCTISREIVNVSDNMSMLVSVVGQFWRNSSRIYSASISCMMYPIVKGSALLKLLAGFGCYYRADSSADISELTPDTLHNSSAIWLGAMSSDGTTTGTWIKGADIENYTGYNKDGNIVNPDFDPSGGGGGGTPGEWDDMPGAGSSIGALAGARCYICSKTDITNLKNWMSKTEADGGPPDGYDVLSSLISVMAFPIDMTPASSGPAQAISFTGLRTSTDNQLMNIAAALMCLTNQIGATPITETKVFTSTATALPSAGNPFTIDLGTCTCPTFYSSDFPFADYDASVELYLPFIGTMSLDTQTVMGNNLHAYMSVDPITGAIYAWCECTKNGSRVVVASGAGAIGVNTPITANQVGMAMAQIKNNAAQSRQTAIQSALTIGMGAFTGVDKNMSSILTKHLTSGNKNVAIAGARDYADALSVGAQQASMMALPNAIGANLNNGRANRQIAQANHNSVSGSAGGSTADWSCSYTPYLKIITPDVHRAGEQYEHTYGVPTILSGTLSTFKGLTFCANPDVSSISTATDQEKQQIFGLLAGGVYV